MDSASKATASYSPRFYKALEERTTKSANEIVPLVLDLVQPRSVVDVGCGLGIWLATFQKYGVEDVWGFDGGWVDPTMLKIPSGRFTVHDLTQPVKSDRRFDLAISVEVAEHLPEECAEPFVRSLTALAPVVLFSAAIPFQGGTDHINEQWPAYWAQHFSRAGYSAVDCIRKAVWQNSEVAWYYAQNVLMFVDEEYLARYSRLKSEAAHTTLGPLSLVHPTKYLKVMNSIGEMAVSWLDMVASDLQESVPATEMLILIDEGHFGPSVTARHRVMRLRYPDTEHDWRPATDDAAIHELKRLQELGGRYVAFGWPAFWRFQQYRVFVVYLRANSRCILSNERLALFELRS